MPEKSDKMLLIEARTGKKIDDYLRELYIDRGLGFKKLIEAVKEETGVYIGSYCTIGNWFKIFYIKATHRPGRRKAQVPDKKVKTAV